LRDFDRAIDIAATISHGAYASNHIGVIFAASQIRRRIPLNKEEKRL
jgi:hypothetical protein